MYNIDDIRKHNEFVSDNIIKGFKSGAKQLCKAHQEGDIHPNGKFVWTKLPSGKFDWRVFDKKNNPKKSQITPKYIFDKIQGLNPNKSTISSIGSFVSSQNQQVSDMLAVDLIKFLPKDSTAYNIINNNTNFTEKQLWTIAYELHKNNDYVNPLYENYLYEKNKDKKAKSKNNHINKVTKKVEVNNNVEIEQVEFNVGDKVKYTKLGIGTITFKDEDTIKVMFDGIGVKSFSTQFFNLEKI